MTTTTDVPPPHPGPAAHLGTVRTTVQTLWRGVALDSGPMLAAREHDVVRYRCGSRRFVVLAHPEHVDHVLHRARSSFVKSPEYEPMRVAAGLNLLTDDGDSWALHRARLNPLFAKRRLDGLFDAMCDPVVEMCDELVERQRAGGTVLDVHELMVRMTVRVVAKALFNQDFGVVVDRMHDLVTSGMRAAEVILRLGLVGAMPPASWSALSALARSGVTAPGPLAVVQRVVGGLDRAVGDVVDARLAAPTDEADLLGMMLGVDGDPWPRQRVRDEALIFMLAGHETTANALTWLWWLLAENPEARQRLLDEVDDVLGGRRITSDDLARLPWTLACGQESQRLRSAVPVLVRTAVRDELVDGHRVRAGTSVLVPVHLIHHDPRFWERPEEFDPRRFLPGAPRPHRSAYLPFGGGRRRCIGQSFALMEMVAIAATTSQRLVLDLDPAHPVVLEQALTLRPRHGVRVVATRRGVAA